jgi:acetyl-CoA synthetase
MNGGAEDESNDDGAGGKALKKKGPGPDPRWARHLTRIRAAGRRPPFETDWQVWQETVAGRIGGDGPPWAWWPNPKESAASNLGRLMSARGVRDYRDLHAWSARRRAEFWGEAIARLGIVFRRRPEAILDPASGVEDPRWLPGARLSIVDSCFRLPAGRAAIVSGREGSRALRVTSRGELEALVDRVAAGLAARGLKPGAALALYMPMTVECVAAYLGAIRAGCRVVSIADSFSASELARRCALGGATTVLTVESFSRTGKGIDLYAKVREAGVDRAIVIPAGGPAASPTTTLRRGDLRWKDLLASPAAPAVEAFGPEEVTNVLFSSGTTADPKAIPWTHLTPIKCAMDARFHHDLRPGDVAAWPSNIGWMMGPWLIYAALINGATLALYEGAPNDAGFVRFVRDARVTMLGVVPSLVRAWRSAALVGDRDWRRVRLFSSTGEPSNREDSLWLMSRAAYRAPVIEYLGGTEIGGGHITGTVVQPASPATFTTPALGLDWVILDERDRRVRTNGTGELFLIPPSIGLSQRILNKDHHGSYYAGCPRGPRGAPLRRHGDLFTALPRGFYRAQGRADDTMNLGGIKVGSLELERVLDLHPAVQECAAVAVQPEGEGADRLVVFAVLRKGAATASLKRDLQARLSTDLNPLFRIHDVVVVEALPRTASNKMMRRELRSRYRVSASP